jgi:hypothetical protein
MLLLDSDQVISHDLVETCVSNLEKNPDVDALVLKDISVGMVQGFAGKAQSKYLELTQSDPDITYGTALPRFFRSRVIRSIREPRREIGYFDHAWLYNRALLNGAQVGYVGAIDYHLEYNSTRLMIRKFFKYYGHFLVPALVEDWKLVVGRSIPKRAVFKSGPSLGKEEILNQTLLFGLKAVSTSIGVLHSMLSRVIGN